MVALKRKISDVLRQSQERIQWWTAQHRVQYFAGQQYRDRLGALR